MVTYGNNCQYELDTYIGTPTLSRHLVRIYLPQSTDARFNDFCFEVMATDGSRIVIIEGRMNTLSTSNVTCYNYIIISLFAEYL